MFCAIDGRDCWSNAWMGLAEVEALAGTGTGLGLFHLLYIKQ